MGFNTILLEDEKSEWILEINKISDKRNKVIEIGEY